MTENIRANHWTKDESRFGLKMLESMGWTPGRGLGAKEDGCVEPIKVKSRTDYQGLGYKIRDDQWISHQDEFNALLSQLNGGKTFTDEDCKLQQLEAKSKRSKSRVHFHKLARGKDLSNRSERDIASILGKRQRKEEQQVVEVDDGERRDMRTYFAQKLAEKRIEPRAQAETVSDSSFERPKAKKSKLKRVIFIEELNDVFEERNSTEDIEDEHLDTKKKKNKMKRKSKQQGEEGCDVVKPSKEKTKKSMKKHKEEREPDENRKEDSRKRTRSIKKVSRHKEEECEEEKILCETSSDNGTETEGTVSAGKESSQGRHTTDHCTEGDEETKVSVQTLVETMKTISMFEGSNFFDIKGYDGQIADV